MPGADERDGESRATWVNRTVGEENRSVRQEGDQALGGPKGGFGGEVPGADETLVAARIGMTGEAPDPAELAAEFLPAGPERAEFARLIAIVLRDRLAVWQRLGIV